MSNLPEDCPTPHGSKNQVGPSSFLVSLTFVYFHTLGMDPLRQGGSTDEVFSHLLYGGQYEAAVALAHACWEGATLTSALERAVASLATQCARLQTQGDGEQWSGRCGVPHDGVREARDGDHRGGGLLFHDPCLRKLRLMKCSFSEFDTVKMVVNYESTCSL